ncbi:MAG: hypothetical protein RR607_08260 [Akkermansia sp.]
MKLTDTQWMLAALKNEVESVDVTDRVITYSSARFEDALDSIRSAPDKVVFVIPGGLDLKHNVQAGLAINIQMTRKATLLIAAGTPGNLCGDMQTATAMMDSIIAKILWNKLGDNQIICLPQSADPLEIRYEDAPGKMIWRLDIDIQSRFKNS